MALSADLLRASILGAHERVRTAEADLAAAQDDRAGYIAEAVEAGTIPASEIARDLNLTRDAVYKLIRRYRDGRDADAALADIE